MRVFAGAKLCMVRIADFIFDSIEKKKTYAGNLHVVLFIIPIKNQKCLSLSGKAQQIRPLRAKIK